MLKEQEVLDEGLEEEKEAERERVGQKAKAPVVPVIDVDLSPTEEADGEIARLK